MAYSAASQRNPEDSLHDRSMERKEDETLGKGTIRFHTCAGLCLLYTLQLPVPTQTKIEVVFLIPAHVLTISARRRGVGPTFPLGLHCRVSRSCRR